MTTQPRYTTDECEHGETFTIDEMCGANESCGETFRAELVAMAPGEARYFEFVLVTRTA